MSFLASIKAFFSSFLKASPMDMPVTPPADQPLPDAPGAPAPQSLAAIADRVIDDIYADLQALTHDFNLKSAAAATATALAAAVARKVQDLQAEAARIEAKNQALKDTLAADIKKAADFLSAVI